MIEQEKVNEILKKSKEIEDKIEQKKKEAQEISNKLIELNTKNNFFDFLYLYVEIPLIVFTNS